jgi:CO dehydrogenase maturation factor
MHATVRSVIESARNDRGEVCILDTEASPEHLSRGTAQFAETMLTVVEPYYKSLETGRRMALLGKDLGLDRVALVANKIRDDRELEAVEQFAAQHDLEVAGVVPFDESFPAAERVGQAPLDFSPGSPAVEAITAIGRRLAGAETSADG